MRALVLALLIVLLAGCSGSSKFVGTWRTKDISDTWTLSLLSNGTGSFMVEAKGQTAAIQKWWVDGDVLRYLNAGGKEQAMRVVSVEQDVLTFEEPQGSGHISVYQRVH